MRFEFATATRILFGEGRLKEAGKAVLEMGSRAFVATGLPKTHTRPLFDVLDDHGIEYVAFAVPAEPTVTLVSQGVEAARQSGCDLVIGFGGGSALDTAKAIAIFLTHRGDPYDYLEVIGRGRPLTEPALPCIAIPTTAGTGAEVTRNAVLASPEHGVKVSLRSAMMYPSLALIDPLLTHSLPPEVTASTGMDALTQLIEPYVSLRANPLTDALCREGMRRAARSLPPAFENGSDAAARQDMALASLFGGLALANAGLGAVHGFAGVLGGAYAAPHGAICARLLPPVMATNVHALQERAPGSPVLQRYGEVAQILTGDSRATLADGVAWVSQLCMALHIPPLSAHGMKREDFVDLIEKSTRASSMKANPIELTFAEMSAILEQAL